MEEIEGHGDKGILWESRGNKICVTDDYVLNLKLSSRTYVCAYIYAFNHDVGCQEKSLFPSIIFEDTAVEFSVMIVGMSSFYPKMFTMKKQVFSFLYSYAFNCFGSIINF